MKGAVLQPPADSGMDLANWYWKGVRHSSRNGGQLSRSASTICAFLKRPGADGYAALDYLKGLLSPVERKNGWQLAEQAGDATPYAPGGEAVREYADACCQPTSGTRTSFAMISGTTWWIIWVTPTGTTVAEQ